MRAQGQGLGRGLGLVLVVLLVAGCSLPAPATPPPVSTPTTTSIPTPVTPTPPVYEPRFQGARALADVRAQIFDDAGEIRYRIPGTLGNSEVAHLITARMLGEAFATEWRWFNATYGCEELAMHNVVAQRTGTSGRTIIFAAHYDTRPIADKDPDPALRSQPVIGANDGASGVAVLLELARVLPDTDDTVQFLFFDGEDGGGYKDEGRTVCTDWILGSRAYAASLSAEDAAAIDAMILVDMVGDPELRLPREGHTYSDARARALQDEIYAVANSLGHDQFIDTPSYTIEDDHVPFLERGIPAVDLIHLETGTFFPAWHHTRADDLDTVSADSLAVVGTTLETWLATRS